MKKIFQIFGSMQTMAIMMLIFAVSIGYATIVENDYGIITAKAEIYNARWFEILLGLLTFNLIYNIFKYKMFTLKKAPIFIFHLSFIVIIIGASITRFIGFEGTMHIREHQSSSAILSSDTFFRVDATYKDERVSSEEKSYLSKRGTNSLYSSLNIAGKRVDVELVNYIPDVVETLVEDKKNGVATLSLMVTSGGAGNQITLQEGSFIDNGSYVLDFNSKRTFSKPVISLYVKDHKIYMKHPMELTYLKMDNKEQGSYPASDGEELHSRTLYTSAQGSFVLRSFVEHAIKKLVTNPQASPMRPGYDALVFRVSVANESKELTLFAKVGTLAKQNHINVDGIDVFVSYGSKMIELPFSIYLKDFQLDRYPGSMSPSSYASEVVLIDKEENIEKPYRIYMNNILEHRGYRFFQSSYDPDEKGTILSVNHDPGTLPSYIGYALLALGMFWSLFAKGLRFEALAKKAKKARDAQKVVALLLTLGLALSATPTYAAEQKDDIATILSFDKAHANNFGKLIVQDSGGRMKPLNSLATEIVAKVHRGDSLEIGSVSLDPNQIILGMMIRPDIYKNIKFIYVHDKRVKALIGMKYDEKYAAFSQFFTDPDNMRGYKLAQNAEEATRKAAKNRDKLDKAVLKVDERVNIAYMVYTGALVKIWPKKNDPANKWYGTIEALQTFDKVDADALRDIAMAYFSSVDEALANADWKKADTTLQEIVKYQKFYGAEVYPSQMRIDAEVFYNKAQIFERLYPFYLIVGFILLVLSFVKIIKPSFQIEKFSRASLYILILFFIAHTFGLANRWYISGHAPWSDGYESMIYIGWATVLAGFIFSKRSTMTMASTGILAGLILFVAHLNWMDPRVTNLVPVLNSYWLSIHVSMITASYGFLALGALLGFITLLLFIFKGKDNKQIALSIKELNAINEMSLMIGLAMLTVGNFLGGVWANESWGRYWGWDPKETWALVTILVYAVVVHVRFIKSLYSEFSYAVISLLSFTSVLMTYFGVNYYLAGLHSYAKGDPVPIPDFVPISYAIIFIIIALAYRNKKIA